MEKRILEDRTTINMKTNFLSEVKKEVKYKILMAKADDGNAESGPSPNGPSVYYLEVVNDKGQTEDEAEGYFRFNSKEQAQAWINKQKNPKWYSVELETRKPYKGSGRGKRYKNESIIDKINKYLNESKGISGSLEHLMNSFGFEHDITLADGTFVYMNDEGANINTSIVEEMNIKGTSDNNFKWKVIVGTDKSTGTGISSLKSFLEKVSED